ncbi:MAG TPA: methylated-DNA--[protein]-cysteine S-methyltransferase [Micropepsaceae bacterium]|nr:methylated-DNA--[protein]-cysteine S-methyltransferase [Micropepsaceae bacterium]
MTMDTHRWGVIETRFGKFAACVDAEGTLVQFFLRATDATRAARSAERDDKAIAPVHKQVEEYCAGKRRDFDLDLAPEGTEFQHEVWDALTEIPFGTTTSYGALAKRIGYAKGARAVGLANGANPIGLIVPCHRVIGSDGSLTGYGGGLPLKRALLQHEADVAGYRLDLFD